MSELTQDGEEAVAEIKCNVPGGRIVELLSTAFNKLPAGTKLYAHPAPVSKEPGEARKMSAIPIECYDGLAVYKAMTPIQLGRNSPETVSDVLDALVKLIRDNARKESTHE